MKLEHARVIAVHPEGPSIDCVSLRDGRRLVGVPVYSLDAASDGGTIDLPAPVLGHGQDPATAPLGQRERVALIATDQHGMPHCLGFRFPPVSQMAFKEKNLRIQRHASGVFSAVDAAGNYQWQHPAGIKVLVGASTEFREFQGQGFDKNWHVPASGTPTYFRIQTPAFDLVVNPDGTATMTLSNALTIAADVHITKTLVVDGDVVLGGVDGGAEIGLRHHKHEGVQIGSSDSGGPKPGAGL
ncbi:hypothetical protein SAMN02949497_1234 [Methylomagnum ishizawai]|uniref:Phage protein Gp138 N-terminal domain-containing protein n=1 Tax=Methylomagnum ishizawai TaxID=1760988 RepID=A0A1Y6CTJ4_9GAMM|nr:hypothetical protein [Methylomagnum ishizawai]SMF93938.1 hypothetical protein SAMN02949497_1234 [Methylomagnum ishizawai]